MANRDIKLLPFILLPNLLCFAACTVTQNNASHRASADKLLPDLPCGQINATELIERSATQIHPLSIEANKKMRLVEQIKAATPETIYEILESSGVEKLEKEAAHYREHGMEDKSEDLIRWARLNMRSDTLRFITREQVPAVTESIASDFPNAHAVVQFESPFYNTGASMQLGGVGVDYFEKQALLDDGESVSTWRLETIYKHMEENGLDAIQFLGFHHKGRLHMIGGRFVLDIANANTFLRRSQWDRGPQGIFAIELSKQDSGVALTKIINDTSMNSNQNPTFFDHWVRLGLKFDAFSLAKHSQEFLPEWAFE